MNAKEPASTNLATYRIFVVDDHPMIREGLKFRLSREPDLEVCGEAADSISALQKIAEVQPDLAVIDINLHNGSGLDLVKRLKDRGDTVKALVWSIFPDSLYARRALKAGAVGYINKEEAAQTIVEAIRHILSGGIYLNAETKESVLRQATGHRMTVLDPIDSLSDREMEIFRNMGIGLDTQQIAGKMHISPKTVETHKARIRGKLGVESGAEVLRFAIRWVIENG